LPRGWILVVALALAVFGRSGRLAAEATPTAPAPLATGPAVPGVITTAGEFWNLSDAEKRKSHPVRMELTVLYYDAQWTLFWAESAGQGAYLPVRGQPLPIRTGQRVRLEGTAVPAEGLAGELIKVTVLDESALPAPLPLAGRVGDFALLDTRWVEGEGYVFGQSDPDPTHLLFSVLCENRVVSVRLQISAKEAVPQLLGGRIRFRGVYVVSRDPMGAAQEVDCWISNRTDIELLGWLADDERFKLPLTTLDELASSNQPWVHVIGEVRAQ